MHPNRLCILAGYLCWVLLSPTVAVAQPERVAIDTLLNAWHKAAARADADAFFGAMSERCIYIGTDKTERWTREELREWAKPYFSRGKAWSFQPVERQVFIGQKGKTAWFNETLETWMGVCRASGVLEKVRKSGWKIRQYHLSVTVDNGLIHGFLSLTQPIDSADRAAAVTTIQRLFDGMREGDTAKVAQAFAPNAMLTSALPNRPTAKLLKATDFVSAISQKPADQLWDERIAFFDVRIDEHLATIWTPYQFYLNEQLSHCGVNAFQLSRLAEGWKIQFVTDTRRKNCQDE